MKTIKNIAIFFSTFLFLTQSAFAFTSYPANWYLLPEDQTEHNFIDSKKANETAKDESDNTLESALAVNGKLIEGINNKWEKKEKKEKASWGLDYMIMDIGVSLAGNIGILSGKGSSSAELYWYKKENVKSLADDNKDLDADLSFSQTDDPAMIEAQVNRISSAIIATGKIDDPENLKTNLRSKVLELHSSLSQVNFNPEYSWVPSVFRFDFEIGASGTVNFFASAGGALRLRFEWKILPNKDFKSNKSIKDKVAKKLSKLINTLAYDFQESDLQNFENNGFKVTEVALGLGISAKGDIGAAKGKASAAAYVTFKKQNNFKSIKGLKCSDCLDSIPLIDVNPKSNHLEFAEINKISFKSVETNTEKDSAIFEMSRDVFSKGIQKSMRISDFLVKKSSKKYAEKWEIKKIKPKFAFSLTGDIGTVGVTGSASMTLTLKK